MNVRRGGLHTLREPSFAVALGVLVNAVIFRAQLHVVTTASDMTVHRTIVDWSVGELRSGRLPLDGWLGRIGLGFPVQHQYQTLPHQLTALLAWATSVDRAMTGTTYVLWVTWPVSVYLGARLFRLPTSTSAIAALLAPWIVSAPGYGYEASSYVWRGLGVWSQLWAMWLLPLALGLAWRAVDERQGHARAAVVSAFVMCCHLQTGYVLVIAIAAMAVVGRVRNHWRWLSAALVGAGSLALAAWLIVPALTDLPWTASSEYNEGTVFVDSFGLGKVLGWLVRGELFDDGRLPVITLAVLAGIGTTARRARFDARSRFLLAMFSGCLLLFIGRDPLGPVIDLLPGIDSLLLHRLIAQLHLFGVFLAAIGIVEVFRWLRSAATAAVADPDAWPAVNMTGIAALGLVLIVISGPVRTYERTDARWIDEQRTFDATSGSAVDALVKQARAENPDRRFYAGMLATRGGDYFVGYARTQSRIQQAGPTDVLGYSLRVPSFLADVEVLFNENNPLHYELFNVGWVMQPNGRAVPPNGTRFATKGAHELYRIANAGGYLRVIETQGVRGVERNTIGKTTADLLASPVAPKVWPLLSLAGREVATASFLIGTPSDSPGRMLEQKVRNDAGVFAGTAELNRPAVVAASVAFHPRVVATVDGQRVPTQVVAPGFVGVAVPSGTHDVEFRYGEYPHYLLLFAVGLAALGLLVAADRVLREWVEPVEPPAPRGAGHSAEVGLAAEKRRILAALDARDGRPPPEVVPRIPEPSLRRGKEVGLAAEKRRILALLDERDRIRAQEQRAAEQSRVPTAE